MCESCNGISGDIMRMLRYASMTRHYACVEGLLRAVEETISEDWEESPWGETALFRAAQQGLNRCIGILTERGADVNLQNYDGKTPLLLAAQGGHGNVLKHLYKQELM